LRPIQKAAALRFGFMRLVVFGPALLLGCGDALPRCSRQFAFRLLTFRRVASRCFSAFEFRLKVSNGSGDPFLLALVTN